MKMTLEQFDQFKNLITTAVEKHVASGGKLVQCTFVWQDCLCPIACAVPPVGSKIEDASRSPYVDTVEWRYNASLSRVLDFEVAWDDMWEFICGFDGKDIVFSEIGQFGRELSQKYDQYIVVRQR